MATLRLNRREVTGPGVGAVAVVAKHPSARPADYIIIQRRQQEETRRVAIQKVEDNRQFDFKCRWEQASDAKIRGTAIKRRVNELMQERKQYLRERQLRLRDLLEQEEKGYLQEIAGLAETPLERQAKMRDRLRSLKDAREAERTQVASEKLEQHFLENCEQLRTLKSQQQAQVVATHRQAQLRERDEIQARQKEVDRLYADLWEEDRKAKDLRAARDEEARLARNAEQASALSHQVAVLQEQRRHQAALQAEAERLRLQDEADRAEDARREIEMKALQRQAQATAIARFNRRMMTEQQRRQEEEQALDMRLLNAVLDAEASEDQRLRDRKQQLAREAQQYLEYIRAQKAGQAQWQREIDAMFDSEAEKAWQRRKAQWDAERQARQALMDEVVAVRRLQMDQKRETIAHQRFLAAEEAAKMAAAIEALKAEEAEKERAAEAVRVAAARDLTAQIEENANARARSRQREREEHERLVRTQQLVDEKTMRVLGSEMARSARLASAGSSSALF
eukprot:m.237208 g.237208  ORF g.237208 m.237208 type:complete len:510 (-) comp13099_c0_seq1:123-1652(-)